MRLTAEQLALRRGNHAIECRLYAQDESLKGLANEGHYLDTIDALESELAEAKAQVAAVLDRIPCICETTLCSQPDCGEIHFHPNPKCPRHRVLESEGKAAHERTS